MVTAAIDPVAMAVTSPHGAATREDTTREVTTREDDVAALPPVGTPSPDQHGTRPPRRRLGVPRRHARVPASRAWREGTLTRVQELEALCTWAARQSSAVDQPILHAVAVHLAAARQAAEVRGHLVMDEALLERAMSNLDAAEGMLLTVAPPAYLLGRLPGVLNDVTRHLAPSDHRRRQLEQLGRRVGVCSPGDPAEGRLPTAEQQRALVEAESLTIATASRAAGSAALREQMRLRSFRNVPIVATVLLTLLAATLCLIGLRSPTSLPLCFAPEQQDGSTLVVCPTAQTTVDTPGGGGDPASGDVDDVVRDTVRPVDVLLVELIGLAAGAVAAAAAVRNLRGSSEPHGIPVAVALLKLPTAALTAVLGLLLVRGQFFPGLSALDTSAQILAWALVFGYAQQLFTRLVDAQADTVLSSVRAGNGTVPGDAAVVPAPGR